MQQAWQTMQEHGQSQCMDTRAGLGSPWMTWFVSFTLEWTQTGWRIVFPINDILMLRYSFLSHVAMSCFVSWKPFFLLPNSNWLSQEICSTGILFCLCELHCRWSGGKKNSYYIINYTNNTNTCFASLLRKHLYVSCRDQRRLLVSVTVLNVSHKDLKAALWLSLEGGADLSKSGEHHWFQVWSKTQQVWTLIFAKAYRLLLCLTIN